MLDEERYQELMKLASARFQRGDTHDEVKEVLSSCSNDILLITVVITDAKKKYQEASHKDGIRKILAGAVLILSGFLITMMNFSEKHSFEFALFGLTSAGILLVFWGMIRLLG